MNQIKLTDLEIKDGWLCKDGVKLTCSKQDDYDHEGIIFITTKDCKVKSATIWTEVDREDFQVINIGTLIVGGKYYDAKKLLQAISQDPKAYATDLEI